LRGDKLTDEEIKAVCAAALVHAMECCKAGKPAPTFRELFDRLNELEREDVSQDGSGWDDALGAR
jgi:hypothetical protein